MKYLLIGLVALIWGLIIYKVIKGLAGDDPPPVATKAKPPQPEDTLTTYVLSSMQYPDPFSNELAFEEVEDETEIEPSEQMTSKDDITTPSLPTVVPAIVSPLPPPEIKYAGYIYNPQTRRKTAMITMNGRSMSVGVNDQIDNKTKVLEISDQKITVQHNGKKLDYQIGG